MTPSYSGLKREIPVNNVVFGQIKEPFQCAGRLDHVHRGRDYLVDSSYSRYNGVLNEIRE